MIIIHVKYNLVKYIESTEKPMSLHTSTLSFCGCLWEAASMGNSFKLASTVCITPTYMLLLYLIGLLSIAHEEDPHDFVFSFLEPLSVSICPSVLAHSLLCDWHRKLKWGCGTLALWKTVVIASCSPESSRELWQLLRFSVLTCILICQF